jgi:hypothetical protein
MMDEEGKYRTEIKSFKSIKMNRWVTAEGHRCAAVQVLRFRWVGSWSDVQEGFSSSIVRRWLIGPTRYRWHGGDISGRLDPMVSRLGIGRMGCVFTYIRSLFITVFWIVSLNCNPGWHIQLTIWCNWCRLWVWFLMIPRLEVVKLTPRNVSVWLSRIEFP